MFSVIYVATAGKDDEKYGDAAVNEGVADEEVMGGVWSDTEARRRVVWTGQVDWEEVD